MHVHTSREAGGFKVTTQHLMLYLNNNNNNNNNNENTEIYIAP